MAKADLIDPGNEKADIMLAGGVWSTLYAERHGINRTLAIAGHS